MRIVICCIGYSGFLAACWKALAKRPGVKLSVFATRTDIAYDLSLLEGVDIRLFSRDEARKPNAIVDEIVALRPDVIDVGAWSIPAFKALAYDKRLMDVKKVLSIDTTWKGTLRQRLAKYRLRSFVRRLDAVQVAGDRGRFFALDVGFTPRQVFTGTYAYDEKAFARVANDERNNLPTYRFCYVGRYVPIKGLDTLLAAYGQYRQRVERPWPLECFGSGELKTMMCGDGIVDHGFTQPSQLAQNLMQGGVLVFPSRGDAWGVALAEAAAVGMPLVCSDEVAANIDLVRHLHNGYVFPSGQVDCLTQALIWMHHHTERLSDMGIASRAYAAAYTSERWADRWVDMAERVLND